MKLEIEIRTENAAFEDNAGLEAARILSELAGKIENWAGANEFNLSLRDINGNKVGTVRARE